MSHAYSTTHPTAATHGNSPRVGSIAQGVYRVDSAHTSPTTGEVPAATSAETAGDKDNWLDLHADDLIGRLRQWAAELELREAQLNAAMAQQDVRERQFRIAKGEFEAEQRRQQELIASMREQVAAQARRLAFQIS